MSAEEPKPEKSKRPVARARKGVPFLHTRKVKKVIKTLLEALNEDDIEKVAVVYREAMNANHRVYDSDEKKLVEVPDHKTRLAAANMVAAYKEGLPIQRQVQLTGSFDELGDMIAKVKNSPAAQEALKMLGQNLIQETGSEKAIDVASAAVE